MDLTKFEPYVKDGFLRKVVSPCGKFVLFNYTDATTYAKKWDEITLNSRGTVYEISTGRVMAQAFPKFFNFGELPQEEQDSILNATGFDSFEKADGSLGIIWHDGEKWRVNTRGSFTSDQAIKATEMLEKYNFYNYNIHPFTTILAEIIYPENRIIVDYGEQEKLVFLAAFDRCTGREECHGLSVQISEVLGMESAQKMKYSSIQELIEVRETLPAQEEGFVVRLSSGKRVKFKGVAYLKVARILSGCSALAFWESMEDGKVSQELLETIPEEFREGFDKIAEKLEENYDKVLEEVADDFYYCAKAIGLKLVNITAEHRKELGLLLKKEKLKHSGAMFPFYLGKMEAVDKYLKKQIKPKGNVL